MDNLELLKASVYIAAGVVGLYAAVRGLAAFCEDLSKPLDDVSEIEAAIIEEYKKLGVQRKIRVELSSQSPFIGGSTEERKVIGVDREKDYDIFTIYSLSEITLGMMRRYAYHAAEGHLDIPITNGLLQRVLEDAKMAVVHKFFADLYGGLKLYVSPSNGFVLTNTPRS